MLDLNELAAGGNPAITAEKGAALAQAGAVCLESQGHSQGTPLTIRGNVSNRTCLLAWPSVNSQDRRTWNDDQEATAEGASGIAALLANREIGHQVILRSRKSTPQDPTGFDYWLGDDNIADMSDAERTATESLAFQLAGWQSGSACQDGNIGHTPRQRHRNKGKDPVEIGSDERFG